jgi:hypothetical protein
MSRVVKSIFLLPVAVFAVACGSDVVERALRAAGDNRGELEKVLERYSADEADSLRLRATEFLIANMPGHYTAYSEDIDRLRLQVDSNQAYNYFFRKSMDAVSPFFMKSGQIDRREDIAHISADYLINQIDAAFDRLKSYPWLAEMPFDIFMEYVLRRG